MLNIQSENIESTRLKYRSRFEIVGVMLQAAVRGATKTRLMYEAFLSHSQAQEYISFLLGKKLISLAEDNKHYRPTEKGMRFLVMYAEMKDAVAVEIARPPSPELQPQPAENHGPDEGASPSPEPAGGVQNPRLARLPQRERAGGVG
ncbi:MAG: winged helix-turn-helix domain-containing protein [Nitrososphaerales archaeon]